MGRMLRWESAGTDEPGDQNADSIRRAAQGCTSAYYSLGPHLAGKWAVEIIQIRHGEEMESAGEGLGQDFPSEDAAKAAAQAYEDQDPTA